MRLTRLGAALLLAAWAATACQRQADPPAAAASARAPSPAGSAAPAVPPPGASAAAGGPGATPAARDPAATTADGRFRQVVDGLTSPGLPTLRFTVLADGPPDADGTLRIRAVEVRSAASGELLQRLGDLDTRTPSSGISPVLEQLDLDFDGVPDLRVVEAVPAGPNTPYRNWLRDRATGRFTASPALDEVTAPVFDAQRREIRSDWRDGAARRGSDTYAWRDGRLVPLRRVVHEADARGAAVVRHYEGSDAGWLPAAAPDRRRP